ncbi:MAG: SIR2 family protein [Bacteroidales bacterium]|nr:SIR2 family protein [Bacteroidales bacterium]
MEIENQNIFEHALTTGINLFVGAGFSTLAKDKSGRLLPVGNQLKTELCKNFSKPDYYSLPQLSSILESYSQVDFNNYLTERFTVGEYNPVYDNIKNIRIKNIYTTNIDDLFYRIYKGVTGRFLNDLNTDGSTIDPNGINYLALHGSVCSEEKKYIFDIASLSTIFNDAPRIWRQLSHELEVYPTVFIGYGFNDNSVLQALFSQQTFNRNARKPMWVILRDEDKQYGEYYKSMGFQIINSNLIEFLNYLKSFQIKKTASEIESERFQLLQPYTIPHNLSDVKIQRPILDFFRGSTPKWCDILSGQLYKTHFVQTVLNSVYDKTKNTIIIGAPVSGKTTLLMQVAKDYYSEGVLKLFFDSLTANRAEYIAKLIDTKRTVIFIDNLYDSIDSLSYFDKPNIKLVCSERTHNYGIISHILDENHYNIINVTTLNDIDLQGIYNSLPDSIRKESLQKETHLNLYDKDSLFEFVIRNVSLQNIKDRYNRALTELEEKDTDLAEFLVLCAYFHSCHVPLSFEMAYDYFDGFHYEDIFCLSNDATDIIKDYIPEDDSLYKDMDYYYPRSYYIADVILNSCTASLLSTVMNTILDNIAPIRICNYQVFHKRAFDKNLALKAFNSWEKGKEYYEKAFLYDKKNAYVLQQGALYLAQKKQYELAFSWIDRAISMTDDKYFSIRNSHATILFAANIDKEDSGVREQLDLSMSILEKCMTADARKPFHAKTYAKQSIKYYSRFPDKRAEQYLKTAVFWLNNVIKSAPWDDEAIKLLDQVSLR